jgi:hypothetical protein
LIFSHRHLGQPPLLQHQSRSRPQGQRSSDDAFKLSLSLSRPRIPLGVWEFRNLSLSSLSCLLALFLPPRLHSTPFVQHRHALWRPRSSLKVDLSATASAWATLASTVVRHERLRGGPSRYAVSSTGLFASPTSFRSYLFYTFSIFLLRRVIRPC